MIYIIKKEECDERDKYAKLLTDNKNSEKKFNNYKNFVKLVGNEKFDSVKELNNIDSKYINNQLFLIAIVKRDINLVKILIKLGCKPVLNDFIMSMKSNYDIYLEIKNM
jgi:hypothetical protein